MFTILVLYSKIKVISSFSLAKEATVYSKINAYMHERKNYTVIVFIDYTESLTISYFSYNCMILIVAC